MNDWIISSDKASLVHVIEQLHAQLQQTEPEEHPIYVADSGLYSAENMTRLQEAKIGWASRVPETSQAGKAVLQQEASAWQQSADKRWQYVAIQQSIGERKERWLVVRTPEGIQRARQTADKQANKPTARPTMRWVFQCFEGIELLYIRMGDTTQSLVLRLQPLHHQILAFL